MPDFTLFEQLSVDDTTRDLVQDDAGNVLVTYGDERIRQQMLQRLGGQKGRKQDGTIRPEAWPLDVGLFPDWLGKVFGDPDAPEARATIAEQLLDVPGVARLASLTLAFDPETLELVVTFEAISDDGTVIGGEVAI